MSLGSHIEECEDGGPNDRRANGEKGQDVKSAHKCRADFVCNVMGFVTELLKSISTTSHRTYLPEPGCVSLAGVAPGSVKLREPPQPREAP